LLNSVEHNRGCHPYQRQIRDDLQYRRRRHSRRSDTCSLRMACSSHNTRQSFRSASESAKSPNCPYFRGWSCSCKVSRSPSVSQKTGPRCMKERSSQVCKVCSLSVLNHGQLFRSAMFGGVHTSAAPELDVGTFRQSTSILLSEDLYGFHFDTNGILAEQVQGDVRRAQFGQTLSISHPLGKFTISGELWHFSQPFERGNTVGNLWAVSRALRKNLVIDAGFNRGLTKTSTRWEAFVGFTYLLPHRLWMVRPGFQPRVFLSSLLSVFFALLLWIRVAGL